MGSPRWLLDHNRRDDALKAIADLKVTAVGWSPEIRLAEIEKDIKFAREASRGKWIDCFRGKDLNRTLIGVGVMSFGAGSGKTKTSPRATRTRDNLNALIAHHHLAFRSGFGFVSNYSVLIISSFTPKYLEIFIGG